MAPSLDTLPALRRLCVLSQYDAQAQQEDNFNGFNSNNFVMLT